MSKLLEVFKSAFKCYWEVLSYSTPLLYLTIKWLLNNFLYGPLPRHGEQVPECRAGAVDVKHIVLEILMQFMTEIRYPLKSNRLTNSIKL